MSEMKFPFERVARKYIAVFRCELFIRSHEMTNHRRDASATVHANENQCDAYSVNATRGCNGGECITREFSRYHLISVIYDT